MTDLPSRNSAGPQACPFVGYGDDRDRRGDEPDHRHRCFAVAPPEPRALAHQQAFCLSPGFASCPIFQDWAAREGARVVARGEARDADPDAPRATAPGGAQRGWTAPPPWAAPQQAEADPDVASEPSAEQPAARRATLVTGAAPADDGHATPPGTHPGDTSGGDPRAATVVTAAPAASAPPVARPPVAAPDRPPLVQARPANLVRPPATAPAEDVLPPWERPRRYEAYPMLRTRGFPSIPRVVIALAALLLAFVLVFALVPGLLNRPSGGTGATARPSGTTAAASTSASASASAVLASASAPATARATISTSAQTYVIAPNDSLCGIAKRFGLTTEQLLAANPQITNPNKIRIGQKLTIPPRGGPSGSPGRSPTPPAHTAVPCA